MGMGGRQMGQRRLSVGAEVAAADGHINSLGHRKIAKLIANLILTEPEQKQLK